MFKNTTVLYSNDAVYYTVGQLNTYRGITMISKTLIVSNTQYIPQHIPEGIVKLLWYISNPLPVLPDSLKILIAPHVSFINEVPYGLLYLEVTANTVVNCRKIPVTCHVEVIDFNNITDFYQGIRLISETSVVSNTQNITAQYYPETIKDVVRKASTASDLISLLRAATNKSALGLKNNITAKIKTKLRFVWDLFR